MTDADWLRGGTHTEERGPFTIERWLEIYAVHAHGRADQIRVAREAARTRAIIQFSTAGIAVSPS